MISSQGGLGQFAIPQLESLIEGIKGGNGLASEIILRLSTIIKLFSFLKSDMSSSKHDISSSKNMLCVYDRTKLAEYFRELDYGSLLFILWYELASILNYS